MDFMVIQNVICQILLYISITKYGKNIHTMVSYKVDKFFKISNN